MALPPVSTFKELLQPINISKNEPTTAEKISDEVMVG